MEGLINPKWSDLNIPYFIWKDYPICCVAGIQFIEEESRIFGIKEKIVQLDGIANNIINSLANISDGNKDNLLTDIKNKKKLLADLLIKYNEIEKKFIEEDKFYREELFETYRNKYLSTSFFSFADKKIYLSSMVEIQISLKDKFDDFCEAYYNIRNDFFQINNYIIKFKQLINKDF